jgi:hypothetical protein
MWNVPRISKTELLHPRFSLMRRLPAVIATEAKLANDDFPHDPQKAQMCAQLMICEAIAEYLYLRLGSPACFVPGHLAELFARSNYEVDVNSLRLPIDSFQLVFPVGFCLSDGTALNCMHIFNLRSKLCEQFMDEARKEVMTKEEEQLLKKDIQRSGNPEYAECLPYVEDMGLMFDSYRAHVRDYLFFIPYLNGVQIGQRSIRLGQTIRHEPEKVELERPTSSGRKVTPEIMMEATNVAIAALCRYTTRPETVKDFVLPRSERYNHKGDKKQKKIFCFLDPKIVNQRSTKPGEEPAYSVKPHVRGFVYATLRDERWYRKNPLKPGEPLRIQEREPTIIHPESFEAAV